MCGMSSHCNHYLEGWVLKGLDGLYIMFLSVQKTLVTDVLCFSLGLLRTAHLPVMTMAQIASLVMDCYLKALYHMYNSDLLRLDRTSA